MNTPKHTPGPWTIEGEGIIRSPFGFVGEVAGLDGEEEIEEESAANASLISSAPELLEALREALEWLESAQADEPKDYHNEHLDAAISKARAAIAKAEGLE